MMAFFKESKHLTKVIQDAAARKLPLHPLLDQLDNFSLQHKRKLTVFAKTRHTLMESYDLALDAIVDELRQISITAFCQLEDISSIQVNDSSPKSHIVCANYSNNLAIEIITAIVSKNTLAERTRVMERWIEILRRSFNGGDYQTASAIFFTLNNAAIIRLRSTYANLPETSKKLLKQMEELMDNKTHYQLILLRNKAVIPAFAPCKAHFTHQYELQKKLEDDIKELESTLEKTKKLGGNSTKLMPIESNLQKQKRNLVNIKADIKAFEVDIRALQQSIGTAKINRLRFATLSQPLTKDDFDKKALELTEKAKQLEIQPSLKPIPSSINLITNKHANLVLSKGVAALMEQNKYRQLIMKINFNILELMNEFEGWIKNSKSEKQKKNGRSIANTFKDLRTYLEKKAGTGSIPKLLNWISIVNKMLRASSLVDHAHVEFLKKLLSLLIQEEKFVHSINELDKIKINEIVNRKKLASEMLEQHFDKKKESSGVGKRLSAKRQGKYSTRSRLPSFASESACSIKFNKDDAASSDEELVFVINSESDSDGNYPYLLVESRKPSEEYIQPAGPSFSDYVESPADSSPDDSSPGLSTPSLSTTRVLKLIHRTISNQSLSHRSDSNSSLKRKVKTDKLESFNVAEKSLEGSIKVANLIDFYNSLEHSLDRSPSGNGMQRQSHRLRK